MSTAVLDKATHKGFTTHDRGGRVRVRSTGRGTGTVLVFKGKARPKRVHI